MAGADLADDLERLVALHGAETIAAVIVEPVAGSTGVLVPPVGYLRRLREIATRHGIVLIFDEVITAFGRLGAATASEHFGVTPDLIACAKGLTNAAVPMGAVMVSGEIYRSVVDSASPGIELFHGYNLFGPSAGLRGGHGGAGDLCRGGTVRAGEVAERLLRRRRAFLARRAPCHRYPQHRPGDGDRTGAPPRRAGRAGHGCVPPMLRRGTACPRHPAISSHSRRL